MRLLGILWVCILLGSCEPKPSDSELLKHLVVTTDYEPGAEFSSADTFFLRIDTISYFSNTITQALDTLYAATASDRYPTVVTDAVLNNLQQAGYVAGESQNADWLVYIFILHERNVSVTYQYTPYAYNYYYGSGGYVPRANVSANATLNVTLLDYRVPDVGGGPSVIWYARLGDVVATKNIGVLTTEAIDQAFQQSPYLKKE